MSNRIRWSVLVLAVASTPLLAQLPDSPTGRGGNKIIQLFKTGATSVTTEFMQQSFTEGFLASPTLAERQAWLAEAVDRIGPIELRGVEKTDQFAATILGSSSKTGEKVEIRYEVADSSPHQIAVLEIDEGVGGPQRELTQEEMLTEATEYLENLSTDAFSGTVLIAKGDEVLLEKAIGQASRRYGVPNDMETLFNLGSINKIFTKIAIAQLAARGNLSFDDSVAQHLPDYPNQEVAQKITIQQVVTHSAGLGDIFTEEFIKTSKETFQTPADYFGLFAHQPLLFEPGTSQRYSNGGYMVLGAIVEAVSGMSYDDYVQKHIFDPAGMSRTGSYAMNDPIPNLAKGYTRQQPGDHDDGDHHGHGPDPSAPWRENSFMIPFAGTPAGGGYSNTGDLLRFRHALTRFQLVDPRYTEWVVTAQFPEPAPTKWSHGIGVAGGAPGVNAEMEIGDTYTVITLSNIDPPSASQVARHLRDLIDSISD